MSENEKLVEQLREALTAAAAALAAAEARIKMLEEAGTAAAASLAATLSILERTPSAKKAAGSDKMFAQMMVDYYTALASARQALAHGASNDG